MLNGFLNVGGGLFLFRFILNKFLFNGFLNVGGGLFLFFFI